MKIWRLDRPTRKNDMRIDFILLTYTIMYYKAEVMTDKGRKYILVKADSLSDACKKAEENNCDLLWNNDYEVISVEKSIIDYIIE